MKKKIALLFKDAAIDFFYKFNKIRRNNNQQSSQL